jgi:uncharacterized protein (UPF0333 family)
MKLALGIAIGYYLGKPVKKDGMIDKAVSGITKKAGRALGEYVRKTMDTLTFGEEYARRKR